MQRHWRNDVRTTGFLESGMMEQKGESDTKKPDARKS